MQINNTFHFNSSFFVIVFIQIFAFFEAAPPNGSFFWTDREISCTNYAVNRTRCVLNHPQLGPEQNPECFDEVDENGNKLKTYCALSCEESLEAQLVKKIPSNSPACVQHYTYNLERKRQDWFLWRNGTCLDSSIRFHLICGTPTNPKVFYRENEELFLYEDAEN
ncbi:hypothetical protein CAEBREN_07522 [Caenorhabditis brenneri]|uniref:DUF7808 domain-containing protein n=1 Tax=Caenorhabditis brenneri TaxID=135651 RepID=G0NAU6_CAEBE|nr:hypothetical protein CAEBREN_07522 [Caenorhabditis brenneri]